MFQFLSYIHKIAILKKLDMFNIKFKKGLTFLSGEEILAWLEVNWIFSQHFHGLGVLSPG